MDAAANPPTVTVVVATYRRADQLAGCLDGVRAQSHAADEVVVVVSLRDDETAARVDGLGDDWPELRIVAVAERGAVAAYNRGLAAALGDIVAFVDDDAVPQADWLERIVQAFGQDERIAAAGGRDVITEDGRMLTQRSDAKPPTVGRIRWFGRMVGNHHLGVGAPRDVDVLKGVNMSFRRSAVARLGFDERLWGDGAQVHLELSICLPLRRQGLRIVYDPEISVMHHPARRAAGDRRKIVDADGAAAPAHNEALALLDYFHPAQRLLFAAWALIVGTSEAPGLAVLGRDLIARRPGAWARFTGAQRGRAAAWRSRRIPRTIPHELSEREDGSRASTAIINAQ